MAAIGPEERAISASRFWLRQTGRHPGSFGHPPILLTPVQLLLCIGRLYYSFSMEASADIPPGTLYLLVMKTLARLGSMHGYGIAQYIRQTSDDVLEVEEGSLYPGLQRMLIKGWVVAEWHQSENNRRARYYTLTPQGRKQMARELHKFQRGMSAITKVVEA